MNKTKMLELSFHFLSLAYVSKPSALPLEPSGNFILPQLPLNLWPTHCHSAN